MSLESAACKNIDRLMQAAGWLGDLMSSHDFEDIINVIGGRSGIEAEVADAGGELANYLASRLAEITRAANFENTLPGPVVYDELYEERIRRVRYRINTIMSLDKAECV